jgi:hypothetical protein
VLIDNGGFFPEADTHRDVAWFLMDAMKVLGTDAVGIGERDLRFGVAFLREQLKRTSLPMTSANLFDSRTNKTLTAPYIIKKVGNVRVGMFSLISDESNLGPGKDSLRVEEPSAAARRIIPEIRKKGADVVVLMGQLGKIECEDMVSSIDGIDVVIIGHDAPMLQKGRTIKNTVACYGGEQGQYLCRTELDLDAKRHMTRGDSEAIMLGPEFVEKPEVLKLVKSFEDGFNEKLRKAEMERAKQQSQQTPTNTGGTDHFLGAELCMRCHQDEATQWKTTAHSAAWETLVHAGKDATPDCVPCHVVGYSQPGGFQDAASTPQLANVQCENCHGMGTQHDAFTATAHQITQTTCMQCHNQERDPGFKFEDKVAKIVHSNMSGETLKIHKERLEKGGGTMMKGSAH